MVAEPPVDVAVVVLPAKDVGGGVETDALAPVCATTWRAQVSDRKNAIIERPAMVNLIAAKECGGPVEENEEEQRESGISSKVASPRHHIAHRLLATRSYLPRII